MLSKNLDIALGKKQHAPLKDWKVFKLKTIIKETELGGNYKNTKNVTNLPLIKMGNLGRGKILLEDLNYIRRDEKIDTSHRLKFGDFLFNTRNTLDLVGKVSVWRNELKEAYFDSNIMRIKFDSKHVYDSFFMNHLFNNHDGLKQLKRIATGTTSVAAIYTKDLMNVKLSLPPLDEQKKINSILSTWDKAIELKEKLIEQKKEQKKGLMQKLLTGEVRLPGFKDEWKEESLGKLVKRTKGKSLNYVEKGKYPAIDMEYLETGRFKNFTDSAPVMAKRNDVLILWDGSRAGKTFTGVEGSVGSTFVKLECKSVNNIFLQKHMELYEDKIKKVREGSGIPHVPKDFFQWYKLNLPNKDEQNMIANILTTIDESINILDKELNLLKLQKKGLMQLLLTGKVRVRYNPESIERRWNNANDLSLR